ncbi:MAG: hypothetical protein HRU70_04270 [Phycisphaeraceae bacterium]|nr:MAG: hypothetical protein HRU70_04270 [Phycisphaeraceae bacterium]
MNRPRHCPRTLLAVTALAVLHGCASGPPRHDATDAPVSQAVRSLAFLEGRWVGTMGDDPVEETWSPPMGDSVVGMFRWQNESRTTLWELLSIRDEGGVPVLRLRHFNADFAPWKGECEGVAAMPASELTPSRVVFTNPSPIGGVSSCAYERTPADRLAIEIRFKDPGRPTLRFDLGRAGASGQ